MVAFSARVREIPPEDIQRSVVGGELTHLIREEIEIAVEVVTLYRQRLILVALVLEGVREGVVESDIIGMMPIDHRVVDTDLEVLLADGVDDLACEVASAEIHRVIIGYGAIVKGEPLVMFTGEDDIFGAHLLGQCGPLLGKAFLGLEERPERGFVFIGGDSGRVLNPFHSAPIFSPLPDSGRL